MTQKYQQLDRISERLRKIKRDAEIARKDLEESRKILTQVRGNYNSRQLAGGKGG